MTRHFCTVHCILKLPISIQLKSPVQILYMAGSGRLPLILIIKETECHIPFYETLTRLTLEFVIWKKETKSDLLATRSKAWVCGRSLAGIASSYPAGGHVCVSLVSVVCCQAEVICVGLITHPEESYRVWCVWVWSRNPKRRLRLTRDCPAIKMKETKEALPRHGNVFNYLFNDARAVTAQSL